MTQLPVMLIFSTIHTTIHTFLMPEAAMNSTVAIHTLIIVDCFACDIFGSLARMENATEANL